MNNFEDREECKGGWTMCKGPNNNCNKSFLCGECTQELIENYNIYIDKLILKITQLEIQIKEFYKGEEEFLES